MYALKIPYNLIVYLSNGVPGLVDGQPVLTRLCVCRPDSS